MRCENRDDEEEKYLSTCGEKYPREVSQASGLNLRKVQTLEVQGVMRDDKRQTASLLLLSPALPWKSVRDADTGNPSWIQPVVEEGVCALERVKLGLLVILQIGQWNPQVPSLPVLPEHSQKLPDCPLEETVS